MATTTPNYGWTVPTSTDLVKDGATAIETLGDAIDASMNTALGTKKAGMVLLNTTSFSGVSSQSINDVFSTTYNNYRIQVNITSNTTGDADLLLRMRVSGADNSTSGNYRYSGLYVGSNATTVVGSNSGASATSFIVGSVATPGYTTIDLYNPFESVKTGYNALANYIDTTPISYTFFRGGALTVTTSYTGFTLIPGGAGNITGSVSVFGVNK